MSPGAIIHENPNLLRRSNNFIGNNSEINYHKSDLFRNRLSGSRIYNVDENFLRYYEDDNKSNLQVISGSWFIGFC